MSAAVMNLSGSNLVIKARNNNIIFVIDGIREFDLLAFKRLLPQTQVAISILTLIYL